MNDRPVYQTIAALLEAIANCEKAGNEEWKLRHGERIKQIVDDYLPSGSGWDSGTTLDDSSTPDRLVFSGDFHHMDEFGGYNGWTSHSIIVTPSLAHAFQLRVTGRDRNDIKDYLAEMFGCALAVVVPNVAERAS